MLAPYIRSYDEGFLPFGHVIEVATSRLQLQVQRQVSTIMYSDMSHDNRHGNSES